MKRYMEYKDSGIEWIGQIPSDWDLSKIKYKFTVVNGATPKSGEESFWDGDITWITPADYKTEDIVISDSRKKITVEGLNSCGTSLVPKNSIIVSNRAPIGSIGITAVELCTNQGCKALVKRSDIIEKFVFYFLAVMGNPLNMLGRGTTFLELSSSDLASFNIPLPLYEKQQTISDYLDVKTNAIDALIADKQKLIDLLKEKRQAIISEVVTKGLDKNVNMKDSGIDWVNEIPEHWQVLKIKYLFRLRNERNYLPMEEVRLLSLYTELGVIPHDELEKTTGNKAVTVEDYKNVCKDDIVVNIILCWMGAIGMSDYDGVTSPAYDIYQPDLSIVESRYYHYLFRTPMFNGACYKAGRGIMAMRWRTYSDEFRGIVVPVPPLDEQRLILQYLDKKILQINDTIADIQTQIEKLKEYRQSIISEAVTGKVAI